MSENAAPEKSALIIDGDPNEALTLARHLDGVVERVIIATDAADGLALAKREQPAIILSEIELPDSNGFELRRKLNEDRSLAKLPFVFVSKAASGPNRLLGLRLGAIDFISKPVDLDMLLARVRFHLEQDPPPISPRDRLSGTFTMISCASLLQCIEASKSSGTLLLESAHGRGSLTFAKGWIVDARTPSATGEDAVLELIHLEGARFSYKPLSGEPPEAARSFSVQQILMEAVWLRDEIEHLKEHVPAADARISVASAEAASCFPSSSSWKELVEHPPAQPITVRALAQQLGLGVMRCRAMIAQGVQQGTLRVHADETVVVIEDPDIISEIDDLPYESGEIRGKLLGSGPAPAANVA